MCFNIVRCYEHIGFQTYHICAEAIKKERENVKKKEGKKERKGLISLPSLSLNNHKQNGNGMLSGSN